VLYPATAFERVADSPPVFAIDISTMIRAENQVATEPLPDPKRVFPWLHGLHPANQNQLAFFLARRKNLRRIPEGIRAMTIVKAGGDLSKARLKGAIAPDEVLAPTGNRDAVFHDMDPRDGFSVRNFQIQVAKMATLSDIIVYREDSTKEEELHAIAHKLAKAQKRYREKCIETGLQVEEYSTFVVSSMFAGFNGIATNAS
jgi:dual specificity MAP kinase phosphatase